MADSIGVLLKKAMLEYDKQANHILAPYDLTHTQHRILIHLYSVPPVSVRQADIERYFSMTNPTVNGVLRNMEKKELIKRVPNPVDKRSKVIALTPKAMKMRDELYEWSERFDEEISSNLTEDDLAHLLALLKKMIGPTRQISVTNNIPALFYPERPSDETIIRSSTTISSRLPQEAPFDVKRLRMEFDKDLPGALETYHDRRFEITGIVSKVGADYHSTPGFVLSDSVDGENCAVCGFQNSEVYDRISIGDRVVVRGNYLVLSNWFGLVMKNCELVKVTNEI